MKGVNWIGVVVAVIAAELAGFVWYGLLFSDQYQTLTGITDAQMEAEQWRMGLGVLNLVVVMVGLGVLLDRLNANSWGAGTRWGLFVGFFFGCTVASLGYIYELAPPALTAMGFGYQLLTCTLGGAVIGGLKLGKKAA